ncbi:MAG: thioredoxin [Acholeplasmatales bacterium]|nr:MAG: thioredoxin [Acholeplasmatales bacterium]
MMTCEADAYFDTLIKQPGIHLCIILSDTCPDCTSVRRYLPVLQDFYPQLAIHVFNRVALKKTVVSLAIEGVPAFLLFQDGILLKRWTDRNPKPFIDVKTFIDAGLTKER